MQLCRYTPHRLQRPAASTGTADSCRNARSEHFVRRHRVRRLWSWTPEAPGGRPLFRRLLFMLARVRAVRPVARWRCCARSYHLVYSGKCCLGSFYDARWFFRHRKDSHDQACRLGDRALLTLFLAPSTAIAQRPVGIVDLIDMPGGRPAGVSRRLGAVPCPGRTENQQARDPYLASAVPAESRRLTTERKAKPPRGGRRRPPIALSPSGATTNSPSYAFWPPTAKSPMTFMRAPSGPTWTPDGSAIISRPRSKSTKTCPRARER